MKKTTFLKIVGALGMAGILVFLSGWIALQVVAPEVLSKNAVVITVARSTETQTTGAAVPLSIAAPVPAPVPEGPEPLLALLAGADVARGQTLARTCMICHSFDKGGKNGVGPNLFGIVGQKKDSVSGYTYSGALKKTGGAVWTYAELNKFLWKPRAYAAGTKMVFAGLKKIEDRAAVIAFLRTLDDTPASLPSEAEIKADADALAAK